MKTPKFNISLWFSLLISIEALIFAILTYYKSQYNWLICWLLVGFIFCVIGFFIDFYIQYRTYFISTKDILLKHEALSKEYDKKNKILDEYEMTIANLGHMIIFAMTNLNDGEKNVFKNIFELLSIHKQKISGVKNNE